jgi:hypothetical protein
MSLLKILEKRIIECVRSRDIRHQCGIREMGEWMNIRMTKWNNHHHEWRIARDNCRKGRSPGRPHRRWQKTGLWPKGEKTKKKKYREAALGNICCRYKTDVTSRGTLVSNPVYRLSCMPMLITLFVLCPVSCVVKNTEQEQTRKKPAHGIPPLHPSYNVIPCNYGVSSGPN